MSKLRIEHVAGGYVIPFYSRVDNEEKHKEEALEVIRKVEMFELLCTERSNSDKGCVGCPAFELCNNSER